MDITQDITQPINYKSYWKFGKKKMNIHKMDKLTVLKCCLHCFKKMYNLNKQDAWADLKLRIVTSNKELAFWRIKKEKSSNSLLLFADKLEELETRAEVLGFEIPESYEELKDLLNQERQYVKSKIEQKQQQAVAL